MLNMSLEKYQKISNIVKYNVKHQLEGFADTFVHLQNLTWFATEKVDGTNIRVYWDGYRVSFHGRTDKSVIPAPLMERLQEIFGGEEMENLFEQLFGEKEVILFGEGYGPKIQDGGELYGDKVNFILFDIMIGGVYLGRPNVEDIAAKMGLQIVPIVAKGTLKELIDYVKQHNMSTINEAHEMEGVVAFPEGIELYEKNGKRIALKIKWCDVKKILLEV